MGAREAHSLDRSSVGEVNHLRSDMWNCWYEGKMERFSVWLSVANNVALDFSTKGLGSAIARLKQHLKLLVFQINHLNIRKSMCSKIIYFLFIKGCY